MLRFINQHPVVFGDPEGFDANDVIAAAFDVLRLPVDASLTDVEIALANCQAYCGDEIPALFALAYNIAVANIDETRGQLAMFQQPLVERGSNLDADFEILTSTLQEAI